MSQTYTIGDRTYTLLFPDLLRPLSPQEDEALRESIRRHGVQVPILTDEDDGVIDGGNRVRIASELGLDDVSQEVQSDLTHEQKRELALTLNADRRHLSPEEVRAARQAKVVELRREGKTVREIAEEIGATPATVGRDVQAIVPDETMPTRIQTSDGRTYPARRPQRPADVEEPQQPGLFDEPESHDQEEGETPPHEETEQPASAVRQYVTIPEWEEMHPDEALSMLEELRTSDNRAMNRQSNDSIEWAQWSWNPVTGCRHSCPYCYARDIAERFYEPKFEPAIWPARLSAPMNVPVPREAQHSIGHKNIFTCSMADLFGKWVPAAWIKAVLQTVEQCPQWNFLFLTKFPARMAEFDYPDNAWLGTSVDCQARVSQAEKAFRKVKAKVKWLSCEPILEPLKIDLSLFDWIVLGGASASSQTPEWHPDRAWVLALEEAAARASCKVYEKANLWTRRREYPGQVEPQAQRLPLELCYLPSLKEKS